MNVEFIIFLMILTCTYFLILGLQVLNYGGKTCVLIVHKSMNVLDMDSLMVSSESMQTLVLTLQLLKLILLLLLRR